MSEIHTVEPHICVLAYTDIPASISEQKFGELNAGSQIPLSYLYRLPCIFTGAPLNFNGAPGYIQSNLTPLYCACRRLNIQRYQASNCHSAKSKSKKILFIVGTL